MTVLIPLLARTNTFSAAVKVAEKQPLWVMPKEWRFEALNSLVAHVHAGAVPADTAYTLLLAGAMLIRESHENIDETEAFSVAVTSRISFTDAVYVLTARRLGASYVTNNTNVLANCPDVAVSLEIFGRD